MHQTLPITRRWRGPATRLLAAPVLGLLAAAIMLLIPALASADTSSTLTVVGTSDVSDSGLIPNLIQPEFQAAFPQYTFKYTGKASGVAINLAKAGTGGPSVLIVHAPSLENQFVAGGFSDNNQYGTALFTNDFVLAGSKQDPVGVLGSDPHDIVGAFAAIATAGALGHAEFVSRGGTTTSSGTTLAERAIWQQVDQSGLLAGNANIAFCTVSSADGGGMLPIVPASLPVGGNCPDNGEVQGADIPAWYVNNGDGSVTQSGNVQFSNSCAPPGNNDCYVFTDRGTYDYLADGGTAAGGPDTITNLAIVTRDNSATAIGGANELTNYFHAYIINPSVAGETVNVPAAQAFINFLTSPTVQGQLKNYLANTGDPGGPPFVADASPTVSATPSATTVSGGKTVTMTGTVTNSEPHYAVPSGQTVTVSELFGALPIAVATGNTNAQGAYSVTFTPASSGSYQVSTGPISQIEIGTLSPAYGDILSPAASSTVPLTVAGGVTITTASPSTGGATVTGLVTPSPVDGNGTVTLSARPTMSTGAFTQFASEKLAAGQTTYAASGALKPGTYTVQAAYGDGVAFTGATSATSTVSVIPAKPFSPSYKKLTLKNGRLTLSGTLNNATYASGATIRLFALKTVKVTKAKSKKIARAEHTAAVSFKQVAKATVKTGNKTFTIKAKLTRGYRWILQLQFAQKSQTTTYSKVRYLDVH